MCNLPDPPWQYSKHQTTADEIGKCLDEGLEPTCYSSIFSNTFKTLDSSKVFCFNIFSFFVTHIVSQNVSDQSK